MQFKKRDGLICTLLSIVTCGIYNIYFWYRYGEDVNAVCAEDGEHTQNYIVAFLINMLTCGIFQMYWIYKLASRLDTASKKYDVNVESPALFTLIMYVPYLSFFYACDVMNKFGEKYQALYPNGGPMSGAGNFGQSFTDDFKSTFQGMGSSIKNSAQNVMPTCKNCGATVPFGKNFCKNCGYPVNGPAQPMNQSFGGTPQPMNPQSGGTPVPPSAVPQMQTPPAASVKMCPQCGSALKPGDKFCIVCGTKVE